MSNVKVVMSGHGRGELHIDGVKVPGLVKASVHLKAGKPNRVCLELFADEVEFEGECEVTCLASNEREFGVIRMIGKVGEA